MPLSPPQYLLVLYNNNAIFMIGGGWADYRPTHPKGKKIKCVLLAQWLTWMTMCLTGAVANVADSDRCRCNPKVPSSIPAGGKDFP